jgi:hypothetical protein
VKHSKPIIISSSVQSTMTVIDSNYSLTAAANKLTEVLVHKTSTADIETQNTLNRKQIILSPTIMNYLLNIIFHSPANIRISTFLYCKNCGFTNSMWVNVLRKNPSNATNGHDMKWKTLQCQQQHVQSSQLQTQ